MTESSEAGTPPAREGNPWPDRLRFGLWMATATAIGVLVILHGPLSDRTWWSGAIAILPPLGWPFVLIPFILLVFDRRRLWRSATLLGGLLVLLLVAGEWRSLARLPPGEPAPGLRRIRVVTWNIDNGTGGRERWWAEIQRWEPDLVLLQESESLLPGPPWEEYHVHDSGDCAVLSRWPLEVLPSESVGPWETPSLYHVHLDEGRGFLLGNVRLVLPELLFEYMDSPGLGAARLRESHHVRTAQFPALREQLEAHRRERGDLPVVLGGDFNSPGRVASVRTGLRPLLRDTWIEAGRGWPGTITNQFPIERIDMVWVSAEWAVHDAWVHRPGVSDHRMLVVDLILPD